MQQTKDLVLNYFNSWQQQNWDQLRDCLAEHFSLDSLSMGFNNRDEFVEFCKNGPKWSDVKLLDSLFSDSQATLLYEGVTDTGHKIRVAEFLRLDSNKLIKSSVCISLAN